MKKFILLLSIWTFSLSAAAESHRDLRIDDVQSWEEFKQVVEAQRRDNESKGNAALLSGSLLVIGGLIGYHNADGTVQKLAYSLTQSLGVAGIGYGAYLRWADSDQEIFYESVESSHSLSAANRDELVRNYIQNAHENKNREKWVRILAHSVVAALNIYNGTREQGDLRTGLFVIGGINALAAISISF